MARKPNWMYRQSAVVPYLWQDDELHVVLITSARSGRWVIPKGIIEPHLSACESAIKEAEEEAGVVGEPDDTLIAEYTYEKWGGECHVQVFPLLVTKLRSKWEEAHFRDRATVPIAEAVEMVKPVLCDVLASFREYVEERSQGGEG